MVKVVYSSRLFFDYEFVEWVNTLPEKNLILSNLMHIKAASADFPKEHNVILLNDYSKAIKNGILSKMKLLASFKRVELPEFLIDERDDINRNVRFAIHLTSKKPYQSIILTSPLKEKKYKENGHLKNITTVYVRSGEYALELIKGYFKKFSEAREHHR